MVPQLIMHTHTHTHKRTHNQIFGTRKIHSSPMKMVLQTNRLFLRFRSLCRCFG
ncbi:hypothetical protein Hanom_Chr01g00004541 [Helianthus anomalus]